MQFSFYLFCTYGYQHLFILKTNIYLELHHLLVQFTLAQLSDIPILSYHGLYRFKHC